MVTWTNGIARLCMSEAHVAARLGATKVLKRLGKKHYVAARNSCLVCRYSPREKIFAGRMLLGVGPMAVQMDLADGCQKDGSNAGINP